MFAFQLQTFCNAACGTAKQMDLINKAGASPVQCTWVQFMHVQWTLSIHFRNSLKAEINAFTPVRKCSSIIGAKLFCEDYLNYSAFLLHIDFSLIF